MGSEGSSRDTETAAGHESDTEAVVQCFGGQNGKNITGRNVLSRLRQVAFCFIFHKTNKIVFTP